MRKRWLPFLFQGRQIKEQTNTVARMFFPKYSNFRKILTAKSEALAIQWRLKWALCIWSTVFLDHTCSVCWAEKALRVVFAFPAEMWQCPCDWKWSMWLTDCVVEPECLWLWGTEILTCRWSRAHPGEHIRGTSVVNGVARLHFHPEQENRAVERGATVGTDRSSGKEDIAGFKLRWFYWALLYGCGSRGLDPPKSFNNYVLLTETSASLALFFSCLLRVICLKENLVIQQLCIFSQTYVIKRHLIQ